ncbi:MAG: hypothetical protein WC848_00060 [Parcubacteria group bacterium]|jgi:alanyl-tRNA synthetase
MLTYKELKKKTRFLSKSKGISEISRSHFVNNTFAGDFNYSIGEEPIMRKFGKYLPIEKNWSCSVSQPCVRISDFHKEVKKKSLKHLMVFEMSDIGGIHITTNSHGDGIREKSIESAFAFLTEILKIDPRRIYVSYFSGNTLEALSGNKKYGNKKLPPDDRTPAILRKLGLLEQQLIPDDTAHTFVLTFFPFEFYAGHRNEIFIKSEENGLLEVGTFEFLNLKTKLNKNGQLEDVERMEGFFGGCAIGIERVLMAVNNYPDVFHCDHIFPLYDYILKLSKNRDLTSIHIMCEVLRLLQSIVSDGYEFSSDNYPKRKIKIKKLILQLVRAATFLKIDLNAEIDNLLDENAKLISWKPAMGICDNKKIKELIFSF